MGYRTDVLDFYSAADAYILPSIREGLNVSLMEAMACGLPCAASRIRGNVDLVEAPLFDPRSISEIGSAIAFLKDNHSQLSVKNHKTIHRFDRDTVAKKMSSIY